MADIFDQLDIFDQVAEPTRIPRSEELKRAVSRGVARVGSGLLKGQAALLGPMPAGPFGPRIEPKQVKKEQKQLKETADLLWRVSQDPEIAVVNKDLGSKAISLIGETIPYITATTAATLAAGPLGGFSVGSLVEGNSAYKTAIDAGVPEDQARKIGVGVGLVSGAIEAFGGKSAEALANRATSRLKGKLAQHGARFGTGMVIEALEEGGQEIAAITGEETYRDVDWNERISRTLSAMAGGAFLGGIARTTMGMGRMATEVIPKTQPSDRSIDRQVLASMLPPPLSKPTPVQTTEAIPEFVVQEGGVSTISETEPEIRAAEELTRNIEGERRARMLREDHGRNRASLEGEMRGLIQQAQEIKNINKMARLADQMEQLDKEITRVSDENINTAKMTKLRRIARQQGIEVPEGATRETIRELLRGPQDIVPVRGGFVIRSPIAEKSAWELSEVYPSRQEAEDALLRQRAEEGLQTLEPTQPIQPEEVIQTIRTGEPVGAQPLAAKPVGVQKAVKVGDKPRSKKVLRAVAHKIKRQYKVPDEVYRDLAKSVTGKTSMAAMTREEMGAFTSEMESTYGPPEPLTQKDYETPIQVGDNMTTVGTIVRRAREAVDKLVPKRRSEGLVKIGQSREGLGTKVKRFFFGIDNTPVYHLARILDSGEEGVFSEVLDINSERGRRTRDAFLRSGDTYLSNALEDAQLSPDELAKMSTALNPRLRTQQLISEGAATDRFTENFNGRQFEMTWGRLIDIYLMSGQKDGMRHLIEGGLVIDGVATGPILEEQIADIQKRVEFNPKVKAAVDAIRGVGRDLWTPALNQVSQHLEGKDLATIENWWGLDVYRTKTIAGKKVKTSRNFELNLIENRGIFKDRTRSTAPLIVRDAFNRFTVFNEAIAEYVGMAEPVRTSRILLNDQILSRAIDQKGYGDVYDRIKKIYQRAQGTPTDGGIVSRFMRDHLSALYRSVLVTNPRVIASQYTSVFNYGSYVSKEYITDIPAGLSGDMIRDTISLSDIAWSRFHMGHSSIELGEMARSDAALRAWTGTTADINKLGWTLKISDAAALASGMQIAINEYDAHRTGKIKGRSTKWWAGKTTELPEMSLKTWKEIQAKGEQATPEERQAVQIWQKEVSRRAEYLWQRTQPSWDKWNRSIITSQTGLERILFLFRSFHEKSLTIFNEAKLDYDHSAKSIQDKAEFVNRVAPVLVGYAANSAMRITLGALVTGEIPDMYEYLKGFITSWLAMFPVFGKTLDDSIRRFADAVTDTKPQYRGLSIELFPLQITNIALKSVPDFSQAAGEFVDGDMDKSKEAFMRGLKDLFIGVGVMNGIPVYEINRLKGWLPEEKGKEHPPGRRPPIKKPPRRRP